MLYIKGSIDSAKVDQSRYPPAEREKALAVLDLNGCSIRKTSQKTGVSRPTLSEWLKSRPNDSMEEVRRKEREKFIKSAWSVVHKGINVLEKKISQGELKDVATTIAILVDKIHLLQKTEVMLELTETRQRKMAVSSLSDEQLHHLLTAFQRNKQSSESNSNQSDA